MSLTTSPSRWAVSLAVNGDLRFLSHHDCMCVVERAATRADLPLRYSQGFNPRPLISFPCARPVGVATRDDMIVVSLDQPIEAEDLPAKLNEHAPHGMRFGKARALVAKGTPHPRSIDYRLDLRDTQVDAVGQKLAGLQREKSWPVERAVKTKRQRRKGTTTTRIIDIKDLVTSLKLDGSELSMTLAPRGDVWARPGEVLRLLGLDGRADLARLVRVAVEYEFPGRT